MALVGNISGSNAANPIVYVTGGLHLSASTNAGMEDAFPFIAIEPSSGSLENVGGVTDKLHNRSGVLYFGAVSLQGGITVAGDSNANGLITGDGDGTYTNEGNLEFDGTDLFVAGAGKLELRSATENSSYINSPASGALLLSASNGVALHAPLSGTTTLYSVGGVFSSGHILATGSVTGKSGLMATGPISGSNTLQVVGNSIFGGNLNVTGNLDVDGTISCDDSITIDSITITDTEIGYLDGLTLGTVAASKVITVDSSKDFAGHRNMSGSGILQNVGNVIIGGTLSVTGNADFNGTITCDDSITIDSITITDTEIGYLDGLTLGTVAASKVVTVDSNKDFSGQRNVSGSGVLQNVGNVILGGNLLLSGTAGVGGHLTPITDNSLDLGASDKRWRNIYTGDLHLANDRGDWTLIEEPDFISFRDNKTGRRFKMVMEDITGNGNYGPGNDGEL